MTRVIFFCTFFVVIFQNVHEIDGCTGMNIPAPVPPSSGGGGVSSRKKCLHFDAPVLMSDGTYQRAGDLAIGNQVWNENESTSIILMPILDPDLVEDFIEFKTRNGHGTTVTHGHAVFARVCGENSAESWPIKKAVDLAVGECMPIMDGSEEPIAEVSFIKAKGIAHPITASGKIVTGGVLISTYDLSAGESSQEIAHKTFEPARTMYDWADKIYGLFTDEEYARDVLIRLVNAMGLEKLNQF